MKAPKHFVTLQRLWTAHLSDHVIALAWSPDGRYVAAAAVNGPIQVLDGDTGTVIAAMVGHRFGTMALGWSADSQHLASGGQDGMIRLWDLATGEAQCTLDGGAMWVEHLAWSPPGDSHAPTPPVLASAAGKKLRLWDSAGQLVHAYPDHPSTIAALQWKPHTRCLTSAAYGRVALWEIGNDIPLQEWQWKGSILTLAWSPNGEFIATGEQDATVHFWFARTGRDLQMSGYPTKVQTLSWSADSHWLATGGAVDITVWDCRRNPAGTRPIQLRAHERLLTHLAWQRRGPLLASASDDGRLAVWKPTQRRQALAGIRMNAAITRIAWAPGDDRFAAGTASGTVFVVAAPQ